MSSHLQDAIRRLLIDELGIFLFRENHRPSWLTNERGQRLELDFYIEVAESAIEVQGSQHFEFTPKFHKQASDFEDQLQRDRDKRLLCEQHGITLYAISSADEALIVLQRIRELIPRLEFYKKIRAPREADPNEHPSVRLAARKAKAIRRIATAFLNGHRIDKVVKRVNRDYKLDKYGIAITEEEVPILVAAFFG